MSEWHGRERRRSLIGKVVQGGRERSKSLTDKILRRTSAEISELEEPIWDEDGCTRFFIKQHVDGKDEERILSISEAGFRILNAITKEEIQELPLRKIREWDIHENGGTLVWIPDGRTVHFVQFKSKGQGEKIMDCIKTIIAARLKQAAEEETERQKELAKQAQDAAVPTTNLIDI